MAVKKRLLVVNDLIVGGGVEKLMYDLVWHWHEKYDITVMSYQYEARFYELYPSDVRYICACAKKRITKNLGDRICEKVWGRLYGLWFQHSFQRERFDIVIAMKDGWILQKTAVMHIPLRYAWVHTDYNNYYYTYDLFQGPDNERECMKRFQKVVCVSESIRKGIVDVIGDPGNLLVKYNPVNVNAILEKAEEPVVDVPVKPEACVTRFVTVGRLNHQKGYDLLLEACHMLERDGLQFEVWVIGDKEPWGDEHNRLYRAQKRLGIRSVKFLGGRKNPYKYMRCADWFLSTSIFEGYSLVSQEAAVLDVPLLLTDCSGVRELLGDSEYGIVMGISVLDIYENMKRVIEHPELHEHYRQKIMERKKMINFEERIRAIEDLLF